jgi:hypothetical protein
MTASSKMALVEAAVAAEAAVLVVDFPAEAELTDCHCW